MASFYEKLASRSWRKNDFTVDPSLMKWQEPTVDTEPEGLRDKLREEIEQIAEAEGEDMTMETKTRSGTKLAKFVKFREEKFGGVLFETRQEKVYTLNPTGAALVREIVTGGEGDVIERLKNKFEDSTGTMEAEAREFLACLKDKGLVTE